MGDSPRKYFEHSRPRADRIKSSKYSHESKGSRSDRHSPRREYRNSWNPKHKQSSPNEDIKDSKSKNKNVFTKGQSGLPIKQKKEAEMSSSENSEEEIMFHWENHKWELNQLFFRETDTISKGTESYNDFWKFLKKYESLQKQKKIKAMCHKSSQLPAEGKISASGIPSVYDRKHGISFSLQLDDYDKLMRRLPFSEDRDAKKLSRKRIEEFKFILLLYLDFIQKQKFDKLKNLRNSQKNLPIASHRDELLEKLEENNVVIIAGDTGCGKSTQIPQYLMAAGYTNIACTQPRRIACISLCKRVAYETLNEYGSKIGYQIRFEKSKTEHTKIVFLTEGLLLRQVVSDPTLSMYNVVILDEIHERHLHTDFLLGVMKCLLVQRNDIKVILMSATINIDQFHNYFMGNAPVIQVPGRLYPIKLQYFPIPTLEMGENKDKINPAPYIRVLQLIDSKYPNDERGDVLIFLSGMREISTIVEAASLYAQQNKRWIILPLHSSLSVCEQEKVFDVPPDGVRKCIVSTNIAETSVTIDGVRFVIDSGKVKEMSHDPVCKIQKLKEFWVSQASAEQRKGRAGRTGPGVCFRLFSEEDYASFAQYSTPEIQRVPLDSLILQMISMGLPDVKLFPFIDPPPVENLDASLRALKSHGALTEVQQLTSVGKLLADLPMDIALGKMLVMGSLFHQVDPVLSLASAMSVQSPFTNRAYHNPDCVALNKDFYSDHGDPFTLLSAYREWLYVKSSDQEDSRRWCRKRGLEEQRFYEMTKLRQQFSHMLKDSGLQRLADKLTRASSSRSERAQLQGKLQQLRQMKREFHSQGPRKAKVLKLETDVALGSDDEADVDVGTKLKDLDFKIRYDRKKLDELYKASYVSSSKDLILLKIILCSGLYPNVAIADEHNNYKKGSDQLFHTPSKPFVILHPNGSFSSDPEVLQLSNSDIVELPGFSGRHPCSSRHQLLAFVSLLETNKAYLVNALRIPAAQMLLLFAYSVDTNADVSVIVCDSFLELRFPEATCGQDLLFKAVLLRCKWKRLLDVRLKASKPTLEENSLATEAVRLERELCAGLVDLFLAEPFYSIRRLLAADVKVLHYGPGPGDVVLTTNPFEEGAELSPNAIKGGVDLNEYVTYNCLLDTSCLFTSISTFDSVCPYCDQELHLTTLDRLGHLRRCVDLAVERQPAELDDADGEKKNKKKHFCESCKEWLFLSIKDLVKHQRAHSKTGGSSS